MSLKGTVCAASRPEVGAVILQEDPAWFAGDIYRSMVERGWYLRLYLETGLRWNSHPRTIQEIRQRYPEQVQELEALQTMATDEACGLAEIRQRGFCLLRQNAQAINCALAGAAPDANSLCPAEVGA